MAIKDDITADMKEAMKARDQVRLDTLRSVVSAFNYKRIDAGADLSEADQLAVVQKLVKQRADSIEQFAKAGRTELVAKETREREILEKYLPAQKSAGEIREAVRAALAALPADGRTQAALMKVIMPQMKGLADGNLVRTIASEELAAGG